MADTVQGRNGEGISFYFPPAECCLLCIFSALRGEDWTLPCLRKDPESLTTFILRDRNTLKVCGNVWIPAQALASFHSGLVVNVHLATRFRPFIIYKLNSPFSRLSREEGKKKESRNRVSKFRDGAYACADTHAPPPPPLSKLGKHILTAPSISAWLIYIRASSPFLPLPLRLLIV